MANATYRTSPTIRMNHCKHCNQLVDKYEEYDFVIIVLDLILHKPQVYRHLIFNRLPAYDRGIDPNLVYMALLLLFCDGYHKFSRLRALPCLPDNTIPPGAASTTPRMHIDSPLEFFDRDMLFCLGLSAFQLSLYGPLNYRTAARTLYLRPYLAHFCPVFSHFFAVFSVLTPGFQKVAPKDRGAVP